MKLKRRMRYVGLSHKASSMALRCAAGRLCGFLVRFFLFLRDSKKVSGQMGAKSLCVFGSLEKTQKHIFYVVFISVMGKIHI